MYDNRAELLKVVQRYLAGRANTKEIAFLEAYYDLFEKGENILDALKAEEKKLLEEKMEAHIVGQIGNKRSTPIKPLWRAFTRIAAAAVVLLFLSLGTYYIFHKSPVLIIYAKNDIAPGHNQATLTLANGKKIRLTKGLTGQLAIQDKTVISVDQNNITYNADKTGDQISYNTLSTARGEQSPYPLVLADGTKVWLNAESSITFPTAFNQKERIVKITGEALFEVAHNAKQPFKVQTDKQTIEDIGTTFNVNAYTDEPNTKTTLIEGSVKVNNLILKPGEQTDGQHVTRVNSSQAIAWKDGKFRFVDDNIQTVMRQLARWYNIDVSYAGTDNREGFNAKISSNQNISVVLSALERTNGVHFKIEGRRVIVIR